MAQLVDEPHNFEHVTHLQTKITQHLGRDAVDGVQAHGVLFKQS